MSGLEARLTRLERELDTGSIDFQGSDGRTLRMPPRVALRALLAVVGNEAPQLPEDAAAWLGTYALPGRHDVTALVVRYYREGPETSEPEVVMTDA